jgi:hypothetical protein
VKWPDSVNDEHHDVIYVTETLSSVTYPQITEVVMACKLCAANQAEFSSEICIHFPGRKDLDKPAVFVFSKMSVCLDCGSTRFTVPQTELLLLRESRGEVPKTD